MPYRASRLISATAVFAFAGWMGGAIITAKGGLAGLPSTLLGWESLRAGLLAAGLSSALGAPLLLLRGRVAAIIGWILVSAACTCLAVWVYYLLWPPQWEAPAYKIAGMVLKGYWKHLTPLAIAAGILSGWLTTRPVPVPEAEMSEEQGTG
jgi:hypothetical protein